MIGLNNSLANSPNVKPVALKLWTSAIPSNIPVDCAIMCSSGNAFPSILWIKEALLVFFRSPMMPASIHRSGPKGKDKSSLRSTSSFAL